jgi:superfamily II DNA or RNA helicase
MSLQLKLGPYFDPRVRQRGAEYFAARRVKLTTCRFHVAEAIVRDTSDYEVLLERQDDSLRVSCSCSSSGSGELCKHIWATVLAAEAKGGLRWTGGASPRRLIADRREVEPLAGSLAQPPQESGASAPGSSSPAAAISPEESGLLAIAAQPAKPQKGPPASQAALRKPSRKPASPAPKLGYLMSLASGEVAVQPRKRPSGEIRYLLDLPATERHQFLTLRVEIAPKKRDGSPGPYQPLHLLRTEIAELPDRIDREILALLAGAPSAAPAAAESSPFGNLMLPAQPELSHAKATSLVPLLCQTERFFLRVPEGSPLSAPLVWDGGGPWELGLEARPLESGGCEVSGSLRRGDERLPVSSPDLVLRAGFFLASGRVFRLAASEQFSWITRLRDQGILRYADGDLEKLFQQLFAGAEPPRLELPESMRYEEVRLPPRPLLRLFAPAPKAGDTAERWPGATLAFLYGERQVRAGAFGRVLLQRGQPEEGRSHRLWFRDPETEQRGLARLLELGFRRDAPDVESGALRHQIAPGRIPPAVRALLAEGWSVEAEGKLRRVAGRFRMGVSSGVDWFELRGELDFEGQPVALPELLAAVRRGEDFVVLGDGSLGVLPETWLRRIAPLLRAGEAHEDHLRFAAPQVALLDGWLAEAPETTFDAAFEQARERLRSFAGIAPARAPEGFRGTLRGYQEAGLGWLHFLRDFGFGGCLADDMGLGKTVQVLALLEARRAVRVAEELPPSLLVVPRSLVFNWRAEAERFTPGLRLLDHTGAARAKGDEEEDPFAGCDLVMTTYGTLRRDVGRLREREFDYLILDEAQAIKNADSQTAKAARLLRGRHRLALSGTPVENHLGELWSLLDFLNPGLLGSGALAPARAAELRDPDPETRGHLARALRPFLLRRTKEAVAPELPARVEQTLVCELPAEQRRLYDELRDHYRAGLEARIGQQGMGRAKILVLEALLRLRQAACHPGLIDPRRGEERSAKLDLLVPQLREIAEEGHKALVFSQFTSFLALLRAQLDREGLPYQYLDGKTRDRQACVERFQSDPESRLFLISLKAGGLGLNLTGADYVYLLDPWWNPAIEAQAIDRAHRLGQTRTVFATRLVARDTVEEKILELQKSKRALADAVIQADESLLAGLSRDDLALLLS